MSREATVRFDCFGSHCAVLVTGSGRLGGPELATQLARRQLREWHLRFSRFEPGSELSLFNRDERPRVAVSRTMARLVDAVVRTARRTGGLVDGTLVPEIEQAGYVADMDGSVPLREALELAPRRVPGSPSRFARWREIAVDVRNGVVTRTPGVKIDSGGLGKGLFADLVAERLEGHSAFAIDCGGDLRVGGTPRMVEVASPFDERTLHRFELCDGGAATSGIGRRSWIDPHGAPAHHLLDPGTGRPAFTGIVQATALAPTALEAETLAKAALLSGPMRARQWLGHGGVLVFEDGGHEVIEPNQEC